MIFVIRTSGLVFDRYNFFFVFPYIEPQGQHQLCRHAGTCARPISHYCYEGNMKLGPQDSRYTVGKKRETDAILGDVSGSTSISRWGLFADQVEVGMTYKFSNAKVRRDTKTNALTTGNSYIVQTRYLDGLY